MARKISKTHRVSVRFYFHNPRTFKLGVVLAVVHELEPEAAAARPATTATVHNRRDGNRRLRESRVQFNCCFAATVDFELEEAPTK